LGANGLLWLEEAADIKLNRFKRAVGQELELLLLLERREAPRSSSVELHPRATG
jgi:hypothetical protein